MFSSSFSHLFLSFSFSFSFQLYCEQLHLVHNYFCFCLNSFSIAEYLNGYLDFLFLLSSYVDFPLPRQVDFINEGSPCQICADLGSFPLTICGGPFYDFDLDCLLVYWNPNVLDKGVEIGPIVLSLIRLVYKLCPVCQNFGHMPMAGEVAMYESWQANVIIIIIKESTFAIR